MKLPARLWLVGVCVIALVVGATRLVVRRHVSAPRTLHLDPTTRAILAGADRVEAFRLADFHEGEFRTDAEMETIEKQRLGSLDGYTIRRVGPLQGQDFARRISAALVMADDPQHSLYPSCFDPGVGFRVWHGHAHADIVVCFYCSGTEIVTKDAGGDETWHIHAGLGQARPALLALSRAAFPADPVLNGPWIGT